MSELALAGWVVTLAIKNKNQITICTFNGKGL